MVLKIFEKPCCLVERRKNGKLVVAEQYMKEMEKLDKDLVIIAVVGPRGTGKSYLMNRLAGRTKGKGYFF